MNLHGLVSGAIGIVNPSTSVTIKRSTGYTTGPDGKQVPTYATPVTVSAQVQELSTRDLMHLDSLNVQGSTRALYISGLLSGVDRLNQKGGDLVVIGSETWLTTAILEAWPDWTKVAITKQIDPPL